MFRATAIAIGVLTLLAALATDARAQVWGRTGGWVGHGSTVQGDILRGEGVFLNGLGNYYVDTAVAGSINANTWMRLNTYIVEAFRAENEAKAEHKNARQLHSRSSRTKTTSIASIIVPTSPTSTRGTP